MYKVLKNVVPEDQCDILAGLIRTDQSYRDDEQVPGSHSYYGLSFINTLLGMLCGRMVRETGKNVLPSYSYCRNYKKNSSLAPHMDRPACEYSLTLNLSQSHPWPIYMGGVPITLQKGEACMYKGCEIEHHREPFEGTEYIQVFLHYVDAEGPYRHHAWDATIFTHPNDYDLKFRTTSVSSSNFWTKLNVFSAQECEKITETFKADIRAMTFRDLKQDVLIETRRSNIHWIEKTRENLWIYKRLYEVIKELNSEFFHLDITEITEDIQYTEYTAENNGFYDWHVDCSPQHSRRKLSLSVQLTDPTTYKGCELMFDEKMQAPKTLGSCTVFPSYKSHKAMPITEGTRRALVLWIDGPPLR